MSSPSTIPVLDRLLDPVSECWTIEVAERIASLRVTPEVQARLGELAEKSSDGQLDREERSEYDACVRAINFIGLLQSKARALLASRRPA